jgi:hypothetical protein
MAPLGPLASGPRGPNQDFSGQPSNSPVGSATVTVRSTLITQQVFHHSCLKAAELFWGELEEGPNEGQSFQLPANTLGSAASEPLWRALGFIFTSLAVF